MQTKKEPQLDESLDQFSAEMIVKIALKRALYNHFKDLNPDRDRVIDRMDLADPRFRKALEAVKPSIAKEIDELLNKANDLNAAFRGLEYAIALHTVGIDWPELKAMLEKNKVPVIRAMLKSIKDADNDEAEHVAGFISGLKEIGMDWPELDVIAGSANAGKNLSENQDYNSVIVDKIEAALQSDEYYHTIKGLLKGITLKNTPELGELVPAMMQKAVDAMVGEMEHGDAEAWIIRGNLDPLKDIGLTFPNPELSAITKRYEPRIKHVMDYLKSHGYIMKRFELADEMPNWGIDVSSYLPTMKEILRYLLGMFNDGRYSWAIGSIKELRARGIDHPQFDHMIKLFGNKDDEWDPFMKESKSKKVKASPEDIEAAVNDVRSALSKHEYEEAFKIIKKFKLTDENVEIRNMVPDLVEAAADVMIKMMQRPDYDLEDLERFVKILDKVFWLQYQYVGRGLQARKDEIKATIDSMIKGMLQDEHKLARLYNTIEFLRDYLDIKDIMPDDRSSVAKLLLKIAKTPHAKIVKYLIALLRRDGINYPEFDAIEQHADSMLNESSNALANKMEVMSKGLDALRKNHYLNVFPMNVLSTFEWMIADGDTSEEDVIAALDLIKDKIVKYLLVEIKKSKLTWWEVSRHITELRKLGVSWPELDVLDQSMGSPTEKVMNESRERPPTDPELLRAYFILEDHIDNEEFDYVSYYLAKIGSLPGMPSFSVSFRLDDYKKEIMRDMLNSIKNFEEDPEINMGEDDFLPMINGCRKLGAKWPELDAIERSLRNNGFPDDKVNTVKESQEEEEPWDQKYKSDPFALDRNNLIWRLKERRFEDACDTLSRIGDLDLYDAGEMGQFFTPEVLDLLEKNKRGLMKAVLHSLKDLSTADEWFNIQMMRALNAAGLRWPEIESLNKAWSPSKKKIELNEDEQDERLMAFSYSQFMKNLEADEPQDLAYWLTRIGRNDLPIPITKESSRSLIKPHKQEILKAVLAAVKNPESEEMEEDDLENIIYALRKMHVAWPELDIIERSLKTDLTESEQKPVRTQEQDGSTTWRVNGALHREDGPAVEYPDGNRSWYKHGKLHRADGPAVEYKDGSRVWWLEGKHHTFEGWLRQVKGTLTKSDILKFVVRMFHQDNKNGTIRTIQALRLAGYDYPELDVIWERCFDDYVPAHSK